MKQQATSKTRRFLHLRKITVIAIMLTVVAGMSSAFRFVPKGTTVNLDSVESVKAFKQVYSVLLSPRCVNCHPSGDVPLQGDQSQLHTMSPKRGADGKGLYAMKCSNCHQPSNTPGLHTPPGNPNWHLPPADMKMVFQGRTPNQLAKQLTDPTRNGHKNREQLIKHADDELVVAGWDPGEGRTQPPMSHAEFKKAWLTWLNKGAYAPPAK